MVFPFTPLPLLAQLYYSDAWHSITADVLMRDSGQISITRGRSGEGTRSNPTQATFQLRSSTSAISGVAGRYSPRNPTSDLYGLIGRNTPVRISIGTEHLGAGGGSATAGASHDAPSVTATGAGIVISGWLAGAVGNYTVPGTGSTELDGGFTTARASYAAVAAAGATGTRTATFGSSQVYASASAVLHGSSVTVAETLTGVSTTCDDITLTTAAGTAAGDWLVAVQGWARGVDTTMPDAPAGDDGGWIPLGDSGLISETGAAASHQRLRIWARRVNSAGAQAVIFIGVPEADTTSADNHAVLYRLTGVSDWDIRATCEVPSWPVQWDISASDVWTSIAAGGVMRRLSQGQGAKPLRSPLRRALTGAGVTTQAGADLLPVAYWPLEDAEGSTSAASALPDVGPMTLAGTIEWASISSPGSAALPDLRQSTGRLTGIPPAVSGNWRVGFLIQYTDSTSWNPLAVTIDGGPYARLQVSAGSVIAVTAYTDSGSSTLLTGTAAVSDGEPHYVEIWAVDTGSTVDYQLKVDGSADASTSVSGDTGQPSRVIVQYRGTADSAAVGHVGVWDSTVTGTWTYLIGPAITGHDGEVAGRRIERLCRQEGVALHAVGDLDETTAMGPQSVATLLDLLRECEDADGGVLYEPREVLGLAYRTRASRYNTPVTLALDYAARELLPPLEPTDDDRYLRNAVTAVRTGGSSAPYEADTGPLAVDAVGRYDTSLTVNVQQDNQLPDVAAWLAHLGTVDEARWPTVRVSLTRLGKDGKAALSRTAAAMDAGDRLSIANLPAWMPDAVDQQIEGVTETLRQYERDLYYVCVPASPWTVGVVEDEVLGRADTDGSETAASFVAGTGTSLSVAVTDGPLWINSTDHSAMFPFNIRTGGVVLEVTGITAPASPTFLSGTAAHANNASVSPGLPASIQDGDLLLMLTAIRNSGAGVPVAPSGWTRLEVFPEDSNVQLFGLIAAGTVSAPTVTFTGGVANADTSARIVRFRGGNWHNIDNVVWRAHAQLNASAQNIAYPQMRTATPRALVLYLGWKQDDWTAVPAVAGTGEVMDDVATTGDDQGIVMDRIVLTSESTIAAGSFSVTGGAAAISRGAVVVIRDDRQTFTVTQTPVNGVSRTIPAGTPVSLDTPWVAAL